MRFYRSMKNGIIAVVSAQHAGIFAGSRGHTRKDGEWRAVEKGARVFTFCDPERYERTQCTDYYAKQIYTGTYQDLEQLIAAGGHDLVDNPGDEWSGYVPHAERGELVGDTPDTYERDGFYAVNLADVRKVFGVKFAKDG